jgi:acyl-CoA thioesterase
VLAVLASGDPDFLEEMALTRAAGTLFRGQLSNRFNAPIQPQGGITSTLALHAAATVLGRDDQAVRAMTTVFAGQVLAGPVEVEVEVLREGRGASQVRSTVRPVDGDPAGHVVVATFAADRESPMAFTDTTAPVAPPPDDCVDRWESEAPLHPDVAIGPRPTFFDHFDGRFVSGHMPWDPPWEPTSSEVVSWMRWHHTPLDSNGRPSALALIPPCDTMPGAVFERHGPDERWYLVPSVDLTVQIFDTDLGPGGWMLRRNTSKWAGGGLAQASMELFSQDGRPLAYATQLMHVREADRTLIAERMAGTAEA